MSAHCPGERSEDACYLGRRGWLSSGLILTWCHLAHLFPPPTDSLETIARVAQNNTWHFTIVMILNALCSITVVLCFIREFDNIYFISKYWRMNKGDSPSLWIAWQRQKERRGDGRSTSQVQVRMIAAPLVLAPAYKTPGQSCSLQIGFDLKHKKVRMIRKIVNC